MDKDRVLDTFRRWEESQGAVTPSTPEIEWNVGEYKDAALLVPARGHRSSRLFLVADDRVVGYQPAWTDIELAYEQLMLGPPSCARTA